MLSPFCTGFWTIMRWPYSNRKQTLESFPFKHDCQPVPTWGGGPAEVHRQLQVHPSAQCGPNHDFGSFWLRYFKHTSHLSLKMTYLPKCPKCPLADLQQRKQKYKRSLILNSSSHERSFYNNYIKLKAQGNEVRTKWSPRLDLKFFFLLLKMKKLKTLDLKFWCLHPTSEKTLPSLIWILYLGLLAFLSVSW